jgi:hypothetical protein
MLAFFAPKGQRHSEPALLILFCRSSDGLARPVLAWRGRRRLGALASAGAVDGGVALLILSWRWRH